MWEGAEIWPFNTYVFFFISISKLCKYSNNYCANIGDNNGVFGIYIPTRRDNIYYICAQAEIAYVYMIFTED